MESTNESIISEESKAVHLLFLGKTGVGKTTLINTFVNHFFNKSYNDKWEILIPQSKDQECSFKEYQHSIDPSEFTTKDNIGKSKTRQVHSYEFTSNDKTIVITDTPGLLDTEGIQKDQENMKSIVEGISKYGYISAVVLVVKGECRYDNSLRYYIDKIKEILTRSVIDQILVVCTNSSEQFNLEVYNVFTKNAGFEKDIPKERWFFLDNKWWKNKKTKIMEKGWEKSKGIFDKLYTQASEFRKIYTTDMHDLFKQRKQIENEISTMILSIEAHKIIRDEKMNELKNNQNLSKETETFIVQESKKKRITPTEERNYNCEQCHRTCIQNSSKAGQLYFNWISEKGKCKQCKCPKSQHVYEKALRFVGLDNEAKEQIVEKLRALILNTGVEEFQQSLMEEFRKIIEGKIEIIAKLRVQIENLGIMSVVNYDAFLLYIDALLAGLEKDSDLNFEQKKAKREILEFEKQRYLTFIKYYSKIHSKEIILAEIN